MSYGGAARGGRCSRKGESDLRSQDNRESCEAMEFPDEGEEEDGTEAPESATGKAKADAAESDEDAFDADEAPEGRCGSFVSPILHKLSSFRF